MALRSAILLSLIASLLLLLSLAPPATAATASCPTAASFTGASVAGSFALSNAATAAMVPAAVFNGSQVPTPSSLAVVFTTFGVGASADSVVALPAGAPFAASSLITLDTDTAWPNEVGWWPQNNTRRLTVAGGFFPVPSKATGQVVMLDISGPAPSRLNITRTVLSVSDANFFYHRALWTNVTGASGPGSPSDLVAARAKVPTVGKAQGQLVWLAPPSAPAGPSVRDQDQLWTEVVLAEGPDVFFTPADLDADGKPEFVAAQFFTDKALAVFACSQASWSRCTNGQGVNRYVIDDSEDAGFFDVNYVDVNGDGKRDLLTTTNAANGHGGVFVFELTGDYRQGAAAWTKHQLATGFKPTLPFLPGRGAVGSPAIFQLVPGLSTCRPAISFSGDDGAFAALLLPQSLDPSDWTYSLVVVYNSTGTVGKPALGDLDNDNVMDMVVPDYAENKAVWLRLNVRR